MRILKSIILIVALTFASTALADDYDDGLAAFRQQNYTTALRLFQPLADSGRANAQHIIGIMYDNGWGVKQDYKIAVKWTTLAAVQRFAYAQSNLGVNYLNGQGVAQDYVKAYMWFSISASNGNDKDIKARDLAASKMTPAQIETAQALAQKCIQSNYKQCD